ncbi:uncharacterized protein TRIADDRAFT_61298 [Trichoplax adhaerens]|uniref:Uncharacterized protein n=1 Tax=Trichoplax adhaerens TaxID=10228 RepID=B3SAL1_TRIAD|nr:predicted protein [Trichoplax adhaerens]EDV20278.1 predicted protein [Trichoplax adhaerens]|eukprot:XP_002117228.1 predicted protein [Trichoplax adhaerens]
MKKIKQYPYYTLFRLGMFQCTLDTVERYYSVLDCNDDDWAGAKVLILTAINFDARRELQLTWVEDCYQEKKRIISKENQSLHTQLLSNTAINDDDNERLREIYDVMVRNYRLEQTVSEMKKVLIHSQLSKEISLLGQAMKEISDSPSGNSTIQDKLFYYVSHHVQSKPLQSDRTMRSETSPFLSELSFTTRRNGICIGITLRCPNLPRQAITADHEGFISVSSDLPVPNIGEQGKAYLLAGKNPATFIQDIIWDWIDKVKMTT